MRILFIGLGSIGKRHLLNITSELKARGRAYTIDALRHGMSPLPKDIEGELTQTFTAFDQVVGEYDAAFITNPTARHYETLKAVAAIAKAVFIEKPVFLSKDVDFEALGLRKDGIYYVACPLRRSPVLVRVKELLQTVHPTAVRAICSSYLPDWRKGTDYRRCYSAHEDEGGGVRLDLIHEWDYLSDLFGAPERIVSESGRFSDLEIESEDTACYLARYPDKLLTLHLDYTGRAARRELELFSDQDTIIADIIKNEIAFLKTGTKEQFAPVDIHRAETDSFLDLIEGKIENCNPIERAVETLRFAL